MNIKSSIFTLIFVLSVILFTSCNSDNNDVEPTENTTGSQKNADNEVKNNNSCNTLPVSFSSYNEAVNAVENASFSFTDELPEGKSSWIITANYYSCDNEYGYLIFTTIQGRSYIHEKVPKEVWLNFKNAYSSGSYYNYNIKHRYRLVPN